MLSAPSALAAVPSCLEQSLGAWHLALGPDGSLYFQSNGTIYRLFRTGVKVTVPLSGTASLQGMVVIPDGSLIVSRNWTLYRVSRRGRRAKRNGRQSRRWGLYAITESPGVARVLAIDASGRVREKFPMQRRPTGLAVSGNQLYGTDGVDLWVRRFTPP